MFVGWHIILPGSAIVGIGVEHGVEVCFRHTWHWAVHWRRLIPKFEMKFWQRHAPAKLKWWSPVGRGSLWPRLAGWPSSHPPANRGFLSNIWIFRSTGYHKHPHQYQCVSKIVILEKVNLTILLGPSLSPRCALIRDTWDEIQYKVRKKANNAVGVIMYVV